MRYLINTARYVLLLLLCVPNLAQSTTLEKLRESTGVDLLWKLKQLDLKNIPKITVIIHDEFPKITTGEREFSHGEKVRSVVEAINPHASLVDMSLQNISFEEFKNPTIVNMSYVNFPQFDAQLNNDLELIAKLTKAGAIVVRAAGNDSQIFGSTRITQKVAEQALRINTDPTIPGAYLLVGAGDPVFSGDQAFNKKFGFISEYSALPGIGKDSYVYVNSSLLTLKNNQLQNGQVEFSQQDGTSFAAPAVSGILALLWMHFPKATGKQIVNLLLKSTKRPKQIPPGKIYWLAERTKQGFSWWKGHLKPHHVFGRGEVNALAAYKLGLDGLFAPPNDIDQNPENIFQGISISIEPAKNIRFRSLFKSDNKIVHISEIKRMRDAGYRIYGEILKDVENIVTNYLKTKGTAELTDVVQGQPYFGLEYGFWLLQKDRNMAKKVLKISIESLRKLGLTNRDILDLVDDINFENSMFYKTLEKIALLEQEIFRDMLGYDGTKNSANEIFHNRWQAWVQKTKDYIEDRDRQTTISEDDI